MLPMAVVLKAPTVTAPPANAVLPAVAKPAMLALPSADQPPAMTVAAAPAVNTVTATATTTITTVATALHFSSGGGGGSGLGVVLPITAAGLYGLKVVSSLCVLLTTLGRVRVSPTVRLELSSRPLASAIRYHMLASPHTV